MRSAGIDIGAKYTKVVIIEDGDIISKAMAITGFDILKVVNEVLNKAMESAGLVKDDIDVYIATGAGREIIGSQLKIDNVFSEITCAAKGATRLIPSARTVIDIGAEDCRVSRCDEDGVVQDFATNDKCAAGTGTFIETLARILETDVKEIGVLASRATKTIPINAQCTIFTESEVISLIHHFKAKKEDIARSVLEALAGRIAGIVRRVGVERDVVIVGEPANCGELVRLLGSDLNIDIRVPESPGYVCALGAAILGLERG
jgi:benzoyl-CoA reductase subunit D